LRVLKPRIPFSSMSLVRSGKFLVTPHHQTASSHLNMKAANFLLLQEILLLLRKYHQCRLFRSKCYFHSVKTSWPHHSFPFVLLLWKFPVSDDHIQHLFPAAIFACIINPGILQKGPRRENDTVNALVCASVKNNIIPLHAHYEWCTGTGANM
jgi:hypothetical protein